MNILYIIYLYILLFFFLFCCIINLCHFNINKRNNILEPTEANESTLLRINK